MKAQCNPQVTERQAALYGPKHARRIFYKRIMMESDCFTMISKSRTQLLPSVYLTLFYRTLLTPVVCLLSLGGHVKWDGNATTHNMAHVILSESEQIWISSYPLFVASFVLESTFNFSCVEFVSIQPQEGSELWCLIFAL